MDTLFGQFYSCPTSVMKAVGRATYATGDGPVCSFCFVLMLSYGVAVICNFSARFLYCTVKFASLTYVAFVRCRLGLKI